MYKSFYLHSIYNRQTKYIHAVMLTKEETIKIVNFGDGTHLGHNMKKRMIFEESFFLWERDIKGGF